MTSKPKTRWQFGLGALVLATTALPPLMWIATKATLPLLAGAAYLAMVIACGVGIGVFAWGRRDWRGPPRDSYDRADLFAMLVLSVVAGIVGALFVQAIVWTIWAYFFPPQSYR